MIAIKYLEGIAFQWPEKIRSGVDSLPQNFDELIDQITYDQMILDNQAAFDAWKIQLGALSEVGKLKRLREFWQQKADELAVENIGKGITVAGKSKEVADAFRDVVYYLNANTPTEALSSLAAIVPIPTFLEQSTIDSLSADFTALIGELWPS